MCWVEVLKNIPYGAGSESHHAVSEVLNLYAVKSVDELVLEGIVHRFEWAEFSRRFFTLAFLRERFGRRWLPVPRQGERQGRKER